MHSKASTPEILSLQTSATQASIQSWDCDCACALELPMSAAVAPSGATWTRETDLIHMPLRDGWQAYYNPRGTVGVAVINAEAQHVLGAFGSPIARHEAAARLSEFPSSVARDTIQHLSRIGLLRPSVEVQPRPSRATALSAWLHVTELCSLDCSYCYVHKRPNTMSLDTGLCAIVRLVEMATRHGYNTLKLKYAGGEPTLRFSLIQALHRHASRRAADAGLDLQEVILSNGIGLTDEMLDFMAEAGIQLMVSLDGGPATHDRVRTHRDGRSTHATITGAVERALERGIQPNISITLSSLNLDGAAEAVQFALDRDLPFNLNFYRECIGADSDGPSLLMPDPDRLTEAMRGIFEVIGDHPTYSRPLTGILDRTRLDYAHASPCSAGQDYLVIDTAGRVSACQMLLEEPWTDLADEDPLVTLRLRGKEIFRPVDDLSECQDCAWRKACAGGCPLMRRTRLHSKYCEVYKALFPALIRLEASRLRAADKGHPSLPH